MPGCPLRIRASSTFQRGKPIPGMPASGSLGKGVIFHRATAAIGFRLRGWCRNMKPVTLLCSTANWSRREAVKPISWTSPTTAASPSQARASSMIQRASFSFRGSMKMIRSGVIPKTLSPGGKTFCPEPTQIQAPPFVISEAINAATNPPEAARGPGPTLRNSWTAPVGKTPFGKASVTGPSPISTLAAEGGLNPCSRRISRCSSWMICFWASGTGIWFGI